MAASNGPFQLRSRPGILSQDNVYIINNRSLSMHLQPHVPQPWIPDERNAFITWLKSEFAAANAIIDAFCHHLRLIGNSGEYDLVFAHLQQRRYNWNVILHLQQYFSVADIMAGLQQVAQEKRHVITVDSTPIQNVDRVGLKHNGLNSVDGNKQLNLNRRTLEQTVPEGLQAESPELPKELKNEIEKGKSPLVNDRKEKYAVLLEGKRHPLVTQGLREYKVPETRVQNNQPPIRAAPPSPPLSSDGQKSRDRRKRNSQNRSAPAATKHEGYTSRRSINLNLKSKPEDDARFAAIKVSNQFQYHDDIEGQMVNIVEGLELYESIFNYEEIRRLELVVADLNSGGKPIENDNKEDVTDCIPTSLQVLIDRLVRWHIIPYHKCPDSCRFMIMEKGDRKIADFNSMDLEQPVFLISLLSKCSLVLGSKAARAGSTSTVKDPMELFLPVGSVLVLQGNSAKFALHTLSPVSEKCCHVILGKAAAREGSHIGSPVEVEASNLPEEGLTVHTSQAQSFSDSKTDGTAASGVLPLRLNSSVQITSEVPKPTPQYSFSPVTARQLGPSSPVTLLVPGWSPMPKIVRSSSSGTGVFLPANTSSGYPGQLPYTNSQRRQEILITPMQRAASSPAFFPSSSGEFHQGSSSRSPSMLQ